MTTPSVLPTQYAGNYKDFLKVKQDTDGSARIIAGTVSVPSVLQLTLMLDLFLSLRARVLLSATVPYIAVTLALALRL